MNKITINIIDVDGESYSISSEVNPELSLMDVLKSAEFPMGHCGGIALCASCHCSIEPNSCLPTPSIDEEQMLDQLHNLNADSSRLICQIPCVKDVDGITIRIARD